MYLASRVRTRVQSTKKCRLERAVGVTLEELESRTLLSDVASAYSPVQMTYNQDSVPALPVPDGAPDQVAQLPEGIFGNAVPVSQSPDAQLAPADATPASSSSPSGSDLTPGQITNFYSVGSTQVNGHTVNGSGITIGIVIAEVDTNLESDIDAFDSYYGLPGFALSETSLVVGGVSPANATPGDGWAREIDLDVEYLHTIAPGANMDVVCVPLAGYDNITGVQYAAGLSNVSVVVGGWTYTEFSTESGYDSTFTTPSGHLPVTFIISSGDAGAGGATYPASSPNVIGVGGTMLSGGTSGTEEWWRTGTGVGSEGGVSAYETTPNFQGAVDANRTAGSGALNPYNVADRITPDVSMLASSVSVYDLTDGSSSAPWATGVVGTSLSAPLFAGVVGMVDEGRLDFSGQATTLDGQLAGLNVIYGMHVNGRASAINDILKSDGVTGPGYDEATGLGSPSVPTFVNDLANVDSVEGGSGNDTITGTESGSTLTITNDGSPSSFTIYSASSIFIAGAAGNDSISLDSTVTLPSVLSGGNGDDTVVGGAGSDYLMGGALNDTLAGSTGADFLVGGGGSDTLSGGQGNDTVVAGLGGGSNVAAGLGANLFVSDQGSADTLTSTGSGDEGYYDSGTDSIVGSITLL
jgi:Ca2+-binding RTX toxin-like protein